MQNKLEDVAQLLPEVVHHMIDVVGFADVEKIIQTFGGTTFRFSDGVHYFPRLKALIGLESAVKLRQVFQAEWVYIPRCEVALRELRNQRFRTEFLHLTQGLKMTGRMAMLELCPKYRISDRYGWEVLSLTKYTSTPTPQANLF